MISTETRTVQTIQERLRDRCILCTNGDCKLCSDVTEAADRIDALEKALKAAPDFGGKPTTAFGREYRAWREIARAALSPPSDDTDAQRGGFK
jgi:hypothetical protein